MKTLVNLLPVIILVSILSSCQKNDLPVPITGRHIYYNTADHYSSLNAFFAKNSVPMQTYNVDAVKGGSFTTPQGTKVTIPANEFMTQSYGPVSGTVKIEFRDIYKKSDMLLSNEPTDFGGGRPLLSAGEFFIRATSNGKGVQINTLNGGAKPIKIAQPAALKDTMLAFKQKVDSVFGGGNGGGTWFSSPTDSVFSLASNYVFSLYSFGSTPDSGSWCNSDNPTYYSSYPQTSLTLHSTDTVANYDMTVFLVFKGNNSMVHVYQSGSTPTDFPYNYAPQGLSCTVVGVGVRDGKMYSSFVPITIGANQTVNFTFKPTTTDEFKAQLTPLN